MSSTDNKRSVIVGIFVLLGLVILIAGIFILGGQQNRFVKSVHVKAIFDDVAGLNPGNNVWFSGVKIGTVKAIDFYGKSQVAITMSIEEKAQQYIRKNAKARISSESFIGNRIIVIEGGTNNAPAVAEGDLLEAENPLDTDELMETLQKNNKNLVDITSDIKTLSAKLVKGEGTMGAVLTDTLMATNFRTIVQNLQKASATSVRASGALAQFTSKLNNQEGLANQLLTDTVAFGQLKRSMAQLEQTTNTATDIATNLKQTSDKINNNNSALGVLINDEQFGNQLKQTMSNLESSSSELGETMEAVQNNFLLRGYFKRKAIRDSRNADKADKAEAQEQKDLKEED